MMNAEIREYRDSDYKACRELWAQLSARHAEIYGDASIGGDDPGRGFDDYLADPGRQATWVATVDDAVVGMTGLVGSGVEAAVEPAIVSSGFRSRGVGSKLVERAVQEARKAGIRFLSAQPVARNVEALQFFVDAGFDTVGHVDLFQDLQPERGRVWRSGISIHGKKLRY